MRVHLEEYFSPTVTISTCNWWRSLGALSIPRYSNSTLLAPWIPLSTTRHSPTLRAEPIPLVLLHSKPRARSWSVAAIALRLLIHARFGLARLNSDGSLDSGFGNGGVLTTQLSGEDSISAAVLVQPDGKILAVGSSIDHATGQGNTALARYLPG
jgi:hypothetical protein